MCGVLTLLVSHFGVGVEVVWCEWFGQGRNAPAGNSGWVCPAFSSEGVVAEECFESLNWLWIGGFYWMVSHRRGSVWLEVDVYVVSASLIRQRLEKGERFPKIGWL